MSNKHFLVLSLSVLLAFKAVSNPVFSQTTLSGGRGTFRVYSAETIQAGSIILNSFFLSFINDDETSGFGNDHTWNLGLTYGWTNNLELTMQAIPYQDDQQHNWGPPGDTKLGVKWHLPSSSQRIDTGLRGFLSIPTAKNHNVPFEPFSSGKFSWGVMGLLTFDIPGVLPLKINANFGYLDHDIGTFLSKGSTDQILLGLGFKIPIRAIIFFTEYTGEIFFNNDEISFKDNSMRLTHGFRFRMPFNLVLDLGADISFSRNLKVYPAPLHEYADWKIFAGLTYHFLANRILRFMGNPQKINRKKEERMLEEIKNRREKVEQELDEMLKDLEKQSDDI